ncbi:MAG TPA: hypothetical protein VML36_05390 [Nitrospiria bacterium]|nr:hypothetical protein [Nitrospiria bacterium]
MVSQQSGQKKGFAVIDVLDRQATQVDGQIHWQRRAAPAAIHSLIPAGCIDVMRRMPPNG